MTLPCNCPECQACPSCGSQEHHVLSKHPTGGLFVECVFCRYRWVIQE